MFSEKIKELRKNMNKTQLQVADFLGITRPAYTAYESGKRQPDFEILAKLAEYFNVSIDYLLGKTEIQEPSKVKQAEITDKETLMTFEGKPIPEEDMDLIKRLLRGKE